MPDEFSPLEVLRWLREHGQNGDIEHVHSAYEGTFKSCEGVPFKGEIAHGHGAYESAFKSCRGIPFKGRLTISATRMPDGEQMFVATLKTDEGKRHSSDAENSPLNAVRGSTGMKSGWPLRSSEAVSLDLQATASR